MKNLILYIIPAFIWGSTWLAITFQLGVVDPLVSVFYRFLLAAIILFVYCSAIKMNLKYTARQHLFMALQGVFLFGINYWLVYLAEVHLKSGLVAVIFSTKLLILFADTIITPTAITTATIIIIILFAIPTAVMTESKEKTTSSKSI